MRRKDREIKNLDEVFAVVKNCQVVHVAMAEEGKPYVVALNFGFDRRGDDLVLYLHSAPEGRKMDILKKNPEVYFQMDCAGRLIKGKPGNPCSYSWEFESVMGSGQVEFIENEREQTYALNRIIQHLDNADSWFAFPPQMLAKTCVYRIVSGDFTGKRHGL